MSLNINVNDQKVIEYIEQNGKLCQRGTWSVYGADYQDCRGELARHFSSDGDGCKVIKGDNITIDETRRGKFLDTFHGNEDVLLMEVHGYGCECGEYEVGELGYYIKETFNDMLLNILGININVNLESDYSWF